MGIKSDIQIAQENKMQEIKDVAKKAGIDEKGSKQALVVCVT